MLLLLYHFLHTHILKSFYPCSISCNVIDQETVMRSKFSRIFSQYNIDHGIFWVCLIYHNHPHTIQSIAYISKKVSVLWNEKQENFRTNFIIMFCFKIIINFCAFSNKILKLKIAVIRWSHWILQTIRGCTSVSKSVTSRKNRSRRKSEEYL